MPDGFDPIEAIADWADGFYYCEGEEESRSYYFTAEEYKLTVGERDALKSFVARLKQQRDARHRLRERLANYAHTAWSGWMKYMFGKCQDTKWLDGPQVAIPQELEKRWTRQMNTPYAELPESEKKSDLDEADKMLAIVEGK